MSKTTIWRTVIFSTLMLHVGIASCSASSISGTVRDSEGAVISGAKIIVYRDSSIAGSTESKDLVTISNQNGQFTLEAVPGFYDIFVSAPAFSPQCMKLHVREAAPAIYMPRLHADPLVTKERGDTFSK